MIIHTETVEQVLDRGERVTLLKQIVRTGPRVPLGMVRKRLPPPAEPRGVVLLVHGFGQNRYVWHVPGRSFSAFLAREGWDVFNLELRGHGRSRRFGAAAPKFLDEYIREDLPQCAEEALSLSGATRLFLIGHSMGGLIGYAVAASKLRDATRGVVTLGSPYTFGTGSRTLQALAVAGQAIRSTGILDSNPTIPLHWVGTHLRRRRYLWNSPLIPVPIRAWFPGNVEEEILDEYLRRAFDWTSLEVAFSLFRFGDRIAMLSSDGRVDYKTAFEALDRPVLVLAGSHDNWAPPASVRPGFEVSRSTDKTYREFPLGHMDLILGRSAPGTVWPTIAGWLKQR